MSIKTRERRKDLAHTYVNVDWDKLEKGSDSWGAEAYFAYVRIVPKNGCITLFLLPFNIAKNSKNFSVVKAEKEKSEHFPFYMRFKKGYERRENW